MRRLVRFGVENPPFNHVLTLLIIVAGVYCLLTIPRELNPFVAFNWLFVDTAYPGASPEEVEQKVTGPLEDKLLNLQDLDFLTSQSYVGTSLLFVRFKPVPDDTFERRIQEVRNAADSVDLPAGAKDTEIEEFNSYDLRPVAQVAVFGETPWRELTERARDLRRKIERMDGVDEATIFGDRDPEIRVELDPHKLRYYRISAGDVIRALAARNLNLPGGILRTSTREYLVRTQAELGSLDEIRRAVIRADTTGRNVTIADVAHVRRTFADPTILTRFEERPCLILSITKNRHGSSLRIVDSIRKLLDRERRAAPTGIHYRLIDDSSADIRHSLHILESNAAMGFVLVLILLLVVLGWRSALVTAFGIPASFFMAVTYMRVTGETLNQSSLFALVLVLGMVVDDAIVIVESCHTTLRRRVLEPARAVLDGVAQVAAPVAVSSLTTILGFLPLMLMPGIMGRFMRVIPLVVSVTLVASLVEAFLILPGHIVSLEAGAAAAGRWSGGLVSLVALQKGYVKLLVRALRRRYLFVAGVIVLLAASVALALNLGLDLFAEDALPSFKVLVRMPAGSSLENTGRVLRKIQGVVDRLPRREVEYTSVSAGLIQGSEIWTFLPSVGQVTVHLVPRHQRRRTVPEIAESIRKAVKAVPGPKSVEIQLDSQGPPAGADLEILIKDRRLDRLERLSGVFQARLAAIPGVRDIHDDLDHGTRDITVRVDGERVRRWGLTVAGIARELQTAISGTTATVVHEGDRDVDLVVRFARPARSSVEAIRSMQFRNPAGEMVAFTDVASIRPRTSLSDIRHHNGQRAVTVRASVDSRVTSLSEVSSRLGPIFLDLRRKYPGSNFEIWGQWKQFIDSFKSLGVLFGFGLMMIYLLLVAQFRSLLQPLVILVVVPLSFIGAAAGLLILHRPVTIAALYGFVALAGVAVNDSIVLVAFVNDVRRRLADRSKSLLVAGQQRLRPIILTSITTIAGLLPMALGAGGSSGAWQSLAVTVVGGLVVSTAISLFGIPVLLHVLDDLKKPVGKAPRPGVHMILKPVERSPAGHPSPAPGPGEPAAR